MIHMHITPATTLLAVGKASVTLPPSAVCAYWLLTFSNMDVTHMKVVNYPNKCSLII